MRHLERARRALRNALLDDDVEQLYERAPCGYLSIRPDGVVVKVNQTFLTWVGLRREDVVGRRFVDLLTGGGRIYHETHYAPMLELQGSVREIALEIVRADGAVLPVLVNAALERDADGRAVVIRAALLDATDRRGYERELLASKRRAEESEARAVALVRTLQQTLVPPTPPTIPGLDVAAVYRPAGDGQEVGGDFYDIFQVSLGDWVVALGDVSGKGIDAAVVTSLVRHTLRGVSVLARDPSEALRELNRVLLAHDTDRFCTVALCRFIRVGDGWRLLTSSGGHPPPLLWRTGGAPTPVEGPGFLVGVFEEAEFTTVETLLAAGDAVVLYTDGVTEGRRGDEFYGADRMGARLRALGPEPDAFTQGLLHDVLDFQNGSARDDIAVLGVRLPLADGTGAPTQKA